MDARANTRRDWSRWARELSRTLCTSLRFTRCALLPQSLPYSGPATRSNAGPTGTGGLRALAGHSSSLRLTVCLPLQVALSVPSECEDVVSMALTCMHSL